MEGGSPRLVSKCRLALMPAAGGWHCRAEEEEEEEELRLRHPLERDPPASLSPAKIVLYSVSASTGVAPLEITSWYEVLIASLEALLSG